ncbi:MAG TPA: MFS transporter [Fibrobacteraceae bacterium]|nr:MFS transporter [Fibrobacteraceae bacterium]
METHKKSPTAQILALSFSHVVNDWYMNFLPATLPLLVLSGLSVQRSALLMSIFTLTSSVIQPVFGYLVDRFHQNWLVYLGTAWMALLLSFTGVVHSYGLLVVLALFSGLGTAAFHPQASAMVARLGGTRKAFWMGFFISMGNVGVALAPLLLVPYLQRYGLPATRYLFVPGFVAAFLVWLAIPQNGGAPQIKKAPPTLGNLKSALRPLLKILSVVSLRSWTYFSLISFLPLFHKAKGIPLDSSGRLLFLMLATGAAGGLLGGYFWDKIRGKTRVNWLLVLTLALSSPLLMTYLLSPESTYSLIILGLAGALLLGSFSITVILAQDAVGQNAALASGLMLGLGIGIGGLGVGITGWAIDHWGAVPVLQGLVWLPFCAALLALSLKKVEKRAD